MYKILNLLILGMVRMREDGTGTRLILFGKISETRVKKANQIL